MQPHIAGDRGVPVGTLLPSVLSDHLHVYLSAPNSRWRGCGQNLPSHRARHDRLRSGRPQWRSLFAVRHGCRRSGRDRCGCQPDSPHAETRNPPLAPKSPWGSTLCSPAPITVSMEGEKPLAELLCPCRAGSNTVVKRDLPATYCSNLRSLPDRRSSVRRFFGSISNHAINANATCSTT